MKLFKQIFLGIILTISLLLSVGSCKKDNYVNSDQVNISISADTVLFDTVFTSVGSITKRVKIRNHEDEKVNLNSIYVEKQPGLTFKINVDGVFKPIVNDIEIYPNDSIFVFIEATVDPNSDANPFIIEDDLVVVANATEKRVHLIAWGQNAHYYHKETADTFFNADGDTLLLSHVRFDEDTTLTSDLPHVFYSSIVVRDNATLTISEGARIHLAHNASIFVHDGGKLHINGSGFDENRVIIAGSRLDDDYVDRPGQWGVIRICQDAGESWIKNAEIRNGTIGCYLGGPFIADLFDVNLTPKLTVENSIITNMNQYGLLLQAGNTTIENSEISDCGEIAIFNYIGGKCEIIHSTIANYFPGRGTVSMVLTNHVTDDLNKIYFQKPLDFSMQNSILYGSYKTELVINKKEDELLEANFNTCLIRAEEDKDLDLTDATIFTDCIFNEDPLFVRKYENRNSDYQLDTLSAAQNIANPTFSGLVPTDLSGKSRLQDGQPDVGAYERED